MGVAPLPPTKGSPPLAQSQQHLHGFASLGWYEEAIRFLFTFAAKTSEVLLAAGLVVSTANFLTDGKIMGASTWLATEWAWAQALAIDSSLGVTFHSVFISIKQHEWIKVICYGLLTLLLAVVAGTITNIDTLSHAIHISIASAIPQVGLNVKVLTTLRAIAVVGFVLMSRLKDVSLKELYGMAPSPGAPSLSKPATPEEIESMRVLVRTLINEALSERRIVVIPRAQNTSSSSGQPGSHYSAQPPPAMVALQPGQEDEPEDQADLEQQSEEARDIRLARAYQELVAQGKRISGRALAAHAHLRRSTCNQWLALHHPESVDEGQAGG
jgi:hypothetical protein